MFYTGSSDMPKALVSWIGDTDLRASRQEEGVGLGPVGQACTARTFDQIVLLTNYSDRDVSAYRRWLEKIADREVDVRFRPLSSPMNFAEIYESARAVVGEVVNHQKPGVELVFHISPGTSVMTVVWIILAKTRFDAELIQSSAKHGVQTVSVPFEIAADFIPDLLRSSDRKLADASASIAPEAPEFADIIHRSKVMKRAVAKASYVAPRSVPVLLEGESGTGKELFARAIHNSSPRRDKRFEPVNCGAIPAELVESELFGHERGAFTGAIGSRPGFFENADGGTLFLDEIGELPLAAQVKLLRVLQENEVRRLGGKTAKKIDVRIVAATNRDLLKEISAGRFRADLFYRLAVAVIKLPPLREREGDLGFLIDRLLDQINSESKSEPGYKQKSLSAGARKLLLRHSWPGNVRELLNTLRRAAIWSRSPEIEADDVSDAIFPEGTPGQLDVLGRPLGDDFNLSNVIEDVARHYLQRAIDESNGNKTVAAKLVGLSSYQTFSNWVAKYKVRSGNSRALLQDNHRRKS